MADLDEFRQLLRVMVFWALYYIPIGVMQFCGNREVDVWDQGVADFQDAFKIEVQPFLLIAYSVQNSVPFIEIVRTGRWDLILHAVSRIPKSSPATTVAASCGNLRLLQYLHEDEFEWHENACIVASFEGHLNCLRYAHEHGCQWNSSVHTAAAHNGHLNCMMYAFSHGLEWQVNVCQQAVLKGHLDCLQFAHENGCPWDNDTTECAAQNGHVTCLQYALEQGCPTEFAACTFACRIGHLDCLQLLHQFGAPWDEFAPYWAAMCPTIDCLRYLHENGCPWDEETPRQAAHDGHIEPLRYALEHGCPYHDSIVQGVVQADSLDCLRYLVEDQGLHINISVFKAALLRGNLANLQYLLDQGCPYIHAEFHNSVEQWTVFDGIFRKDNPEFVLCVEFAVQRGWVLCRNFIRYIVTRDEPCKQWLISEGHYSEGGDGDGVSV